MTLRAGWVFQAGFLVQGRFFRGRSAMPDSAYFRHVIMRIISYVVFIVFASVQVRQSIYLGYFLANRDEIAAAHCENKETSCCKGSCHLTKQLGEMSATSSAAPIYPREPQVVLYFEVTEQSAQVAYVAREHKRSFYGKKEPGNGYPCLSVPPPDNAG